jgi:hypothetical protein
MTEYKVWFTNITGCAVGISDISWSVTVSAESEAEAFELAMKKARVINRQCGLPPHGLRVTEEELRRLACVLPDGQRDATPTAAPAIDEREAVWLASLCMREDLGPELDQWELIPGVEARPEGWVVCFRRVGDFKPRDRPPPRCFYVFGDGTVESVNKHGPNFNEFRRQMNNPPDEKP